MVIAGRMFRNNDAQVQLQLKNQQGSWQEAPECTPRAKNKMQTIKAKLGVGSGYWLSRKWTMVSVTHVISAVSRTGNGQWYHSDPCKFSAHLKSLPITPSNVSQETCTIITQNITKYHTKILSLNRAWWLKYVIPALPWVWGFLRLCSHECQANLGYTFKLCQTTKTKTATKQQKGDYQLTKYSLWTTQNSYF